MGTEIYLADIDPLDDRGIRIVLVNPNQVLIEPVRRDAANEGPWESVGGQIVVSINGLRASLDAVCVDDVDRTAEREGFRMGYQFKTVAMGGSGSRRAENDDDSEAGQ